MFKVILVVCIFQLLGCSILNNISAPKISFEGFMNIKVGKMKMKNIKNKYGKPSNRHEIEKKYIGYENASQWVYKRDGYSRLYITFESEVVRSAFWDVRDNEVEENIEKLLEKVKSKKWLVVKEPARNPHAMPSKCKLVSNERGISILIEGYEKKVSSISLWKPSTMKNQKWFDDSTPEFCIANHCSKVTDPNAWKHNHCEWLEKLVAK